MVAIIVLEKYGYGAPAPVYHDHDYLFVKRSPPTLKTHYPQRSKKKEVSIAYIASIVRGITAASLSTLELDR